MSVPLFFPIPVFVASLDLASASTIADLCDQAGVRCAASGAWTQRRIQLRQGDTFAIEAEPGYVGAVRLTLPPGHPHPARLALAALAYGLFDGVARASIAGQSWARPALPRGRRRTGVALPNSERQRRWRERRWRQPEPPHD